MGRFLLLVFLFFILSISGYCITYTVGGTVTYWNDETSSYNSLINAKISVTSYYDQTYSQTFVYTNTNGYFYQEFNQNHLPDKVQIIVFFYNQYVDLRGAQTTKSDTRDDIILVGSPDPCPINIPCNYDMGQFSNITIRYESWQPQSKYAKIFMLANKANEFARINGYNPPKVIVKYPAERSILNDIPVHIDASFFWPFETISNTDLFGDWFTLYNIGGVLNWLGVTGEITENALYIKDGDATGKNSTVFHEYGHFLMKSKIGYWPVTELEYLYGLIPITHSWNTYQQDERLAYLEGWANFYGSAVQSWVDNPNLPFSGSFDSFPNLFESPIPYQNSNISNGYKHEVLVGAAFFDFYDPANGDDYFNTPFINILNVVGEGHVYMKNFINSFVHKSYLSDQTRNTGIAILNKLTMDPSQSYGNANLKVNNDFHGGTVKIDNILCNTDQTGGEVNQTQLWMSNKALQAVEQDYGGIHRVFKHTNPINTSYTWTSSNLSSYNLTDLWNTYADNLTYTANFDIQVNCIVNYSCAEIGIINPPLSSNIRVINNQISISAPAEIINNGHKYKFINWSNGSVSNPLILNTIANIQLTANYKGTQLSAYQNTFTNSSQRKVISTFSTPSCLFQVYESMGSIWMEKSADGGTNWSLYPYPNGPLISGPAEAPSLDHINNSTYSMGKSGSNNSPEGIYEDVIFVPYIINNDVRIKALSSYSASSIIDYQIGYNGELGSQMNPVIATFNNGYKLIVIWKGYDFQTSQPGLVYAICNFSKSWPYTLTLATQYEVIIPGTNDLSQNPTLEALKDGNVLRLAWEENNTIKYSTITVNNDNTIQLSTPLTISNYAGFTTNTKPSIIAVNGGARLTWVGSRTVGIEELKINGLNKTTYGQTEQKAVFMNPSDTNLVWAFSNNVQSAVINQSPQCYSILWGRNNTSVLQFTDSHSLSTITSLTTTGTDVQLSNGNSDYLMRAVSFNNSTAPYFFNNKNLYNESQQKIESITINSGREGIVKKDSCQFYFAVGDVNVDNKNIEFIPIADTTRFHSLTDLNSYLVTNPIQVNDNSSFYYSVQYGITDPRAAKNVLGGNSFINFKVEIIDATTNEVLGTSDNVTYDATHAFQYDNKSYQVSTEGIGNRTILLRLKITTNSEIGYSLKNSYATDDVLQKINNKRTIVNTLGAVTNYDLSQNYPNPFNPSTIIKYQIPKAGNVTLKVYDILGKEVVNLVNEYQKEGRYNVNFDASKLASGVYIYQIKSNEYTSSKKMMLLK